MNQSEVSALVTALGICIGSVFIKGEGAGLFCLGLMVGAITVATVPPIVRWLSQPSTPS